MSVNAPRIDHEYLSNELGSSAMSERTGTAAPEVTQSPSRAVHSSQRAYIPYDSPSAFRHPSVRPIK